MHGHVVQFLQVLLDFRLAQEVVASEVYGVVVVWFGRAQQQHLMRHKFKLTSWLLKPTRDCWLQSERVHILLEV